MDTAIDSPKHTPLPWQQHDNHPLYGPSYNGPVWGPLGPGHGLVADCRPCGNSTTEAIANAKLIARAVNAFHALRLACEAILADHDSAMRIALDPTPVEEPTGPNLCGSHVLMLRDALALARGETPTPEETHGQARK